MPLYIIQPFNQNTVFYNTFFNMSCGKLSLRLFFLNIAKKKYCFRSLLNYVHQNSNYMIQTGKFRKLNNYTLFDCNGSIKKGYYIFGVYHRFYQNIWVYFVSRIYVGLTYLSFVYDISVNDKHINIFYKIDHHSCSSLHKFNL